MIDNGSKDLDALMQQFLDDELVEAALKQAQPDCSCAPLKEQPPSADRRKQPEPAPVSAADASALRQTGSPDAANATPLRFRQEIAGIASTVLKIPPDRLDVRENMSRYGVDSIIVTEIMKRISDLLDLPIAPTVFFEARHLDELADILYQRYRKTIEKRVLNEEVQPVDKVSHDAGSVQSVGTADIDSAEIDSEVKSWISKFRASVGSHAPAVEETEYRETPENVRSSGETGYEPVAIIAMEGIFPDSPNLQEFEKHLRDGDDCISEVPADRWDWQKVYGDPKQGEFTKVKYGGFAPDIDKFDPLFFGMSPREAELMDPQHRLFIQCVWKLIESAGYAAKSLSGRKIGLFMGINLQDYAHLIDRAGAMEALHLTSLGHMFCPNRLSFFLDIHGPSQVIDTACSSSLVALHRAVLSIQHEGCEMAIAGGANLLISPDMHIMYSKVGMICEDGRCKTFSEQANGYVRSDGVGAVLLKSLKRAERDGDTILAVIRGSAENHGGMSTSLTAPNPKAQAGLIVEAHQKANIDPRSIGYIECHGTGTSLGDPIEINGLKMAFEQLHRSSGVAMPDAAYCGLGSVKSNIGHAETAAGIAGVIKAVLALRNKRLYRSLHCDTINPMIELEQSPFFILQQGSSWQRPVIDGNEQPRRAGVSSFGAGGSNAHVVIEEYSEKPLPPVQRSAPALILLSAKNEARLGDVVENLLGFLNAMPESETPDIADIAFTLQVGREAMAERLAVIADSVAELKAKLGRIVQSREAADCCKGTVKRNKALHEDDTLAPTLRQCFAEGDVRQLAELWVKGVNIDWQALYAETALAGRRPRRVTLPSYPFARQRYWLPETGGNRRIGQAPAQLHPLLHQNTSDLSEQRFSSVFSGNEFFLADHVVMGEKVLPGVAYLEMARAAIKQVSAEADGNPVNIRLKNVVWARPFVLGNQPTPLHIGLYPEQHNQIAYRIYSKTGDSVVLHSQGTAVVQAEPSSDAAAEKLDLSALREKMTERNSLDAKQCYDAFRVMGIAYGPGHQGLETVYYSAPESNAATPQVLAKLALPACVESGAAQFVLHPGLIDSGLQACIGLMAGSGHALPTGAASGASKTAASLPFALDELTLPAQPSATMWAWIRYADGSSPTGKVQKLNIDLCDEQGRICVRMKGFSSRSLEQKQAAETSAMLMCKPVWADQTVAHDAPGLAWAQHLVILCDLDRCFADSTLQDIAARIPGASCTRLNLNGAIEDSYKDAAIQVFEMIKQAFARKATGNTLLQVLVPGRGKGMLLGGLSGLLKTASRENARFFGQLIELDAGETWNGLAAKIIEGSRTPEQAQIRYSGRVPQVLSWEEADIATSSVVPWKDNGVYLITGGSGGLGLLFAKQIAQHAKNATVVLCGRSALSPQKQAQIDRLSASGLKAEYRQLDVGQRQDVDDLVARLLDAHGRIDGILHCAGLLRDNFIQKKSAQEFTEVLAPKVAGTLHLDKATANIDLDFLALFSSAAGAWGSAGQADYAAANAFMDAFAEYRNEQVKDGQRRGHTLSINWPLWADGGMRMEASAEAMMRQTTGMVALPAENGIDAFNRIMASGAAQMMVMQGSPVRIRRLLVTPEKTVKKITPDRNDDIATGPQIDTGELQAKIRQMLLQAVAKLMKFEPDDLDADAEFSDYGFDSITLTDFSNKLNQQYQLELTPTIFFEYPTIAGFADWLASEYPSVFAQAFGLQARPVQSREAAAYQAPDHSEYAEQPVSTPIQPHARFTNAAGADEPAGDTDKAVAIIGISGRFPMANDLDQFWSNLLDGKDCISEIPEDRWDWRALYGDPATEANKTNIKWGGFIDGVGNFDARFFGISPREAELMDPQQRLLMQYVWKAIEDAGYSADSLSGSNTAIFIGTASSGYGELMAKSGSAIESYSSTGVVGSVGPNRMSYFLNLHGPSEPVETACSSSLVAIHRALAAIANGDCDQAIVGGINLIISPETQISFNKAGMLCQDGRCKTFSSQANGYVRGEGVGMLFLKKLKAAEQAGDHIYGVIRGSAENHGGRGNSLTAPNPKAQAELLKAAYARAGIDPRTVSYIEAHGTGTELGDPIEINGLKTAFKDLYQATGTPEIAAAHCGLGSVKTNIGHLELAAGVAGVIKVLLQLKHKTLVKSLHCDEVNPYIQLQDSPFYLVRDNREWTPLRDPEGRELPRRAGVSSFGFGGVNAHIVIEEYRQGAADNAEPETPSLVLLSAKNQDRLKAYVEELLAYINASTVADNQNSGHAQQVLSHTVRALVADILQTNPNEIEPAQVLDDYGFDPVHRTMLLARLQQAFELEIEAKTVLDNHSVAAMAAGVLENHPELHGRLNQEQAAPALESEQPRPEGNKKYGFRLADLAYTLQVGREPMEERFAVIAASIEELEDKLRAFIEGRTDAVNDLYLGQIKQHKHILAAFAADEELQEALEKWMQRGKFSKLLDMWVKGLNLDWEKLYGEAKPYRNKPHRISAPGYPFAEQRYWIEARPGSTSNLAGASAQLHPLVHQNVSTLQQVGFATALTGNEFFLADHRVQGQKVLPGVAYLEMARAAATIAAGRERDPKTPFRLQDVVWLRPVVVKQPHSIGIELTNGLDGAINYRVFTDGSAEPGRLVHSQGSVSFKRTVNPARLDPGAMLAQAGMSRFDAAQCYPLFSTLGLDYGPGHQGIAELYTGNGQVLARLVLPESVQHTLDQYVLHPSLMDSALQASIGLGMTAETTAPSGERLKPALPFALETVDVFGACAGSMWAWVRRSNGSSAGDRVQKLDIDLCNDQGQVCVQIKGFSSRLLDTDGADSTAKPADTISPITGHKPSAPVDAAELRNQTIDYFKQLLSSTLKYPVSEIRTDESLDFYGIDSMMVMELTAALEKPFGPLSKTLFFEYQTLAELVDYFLEAQRSNLLKLFGVDKPDVAVAALADHAPAQSVKTEFKPAPAANAATIAPAKPNVGALDIAVVGLSGRYPQARNIEEFWRNLRDGRNCITEVPEERWDWHAYYSEDQSQPGRHSSKWGGFIADVDKFDPLFFNISPREAEYMDPQERLFLEHAWMAMEDAGYRREDLQKPLTGSLNDDDMPAQVGVYAGVMYGEYQLLGLEGSLSGKNTLSASFYASVANRVSYFLNLHGPSMTVDTMCSSSLTAIHLACQDLKLGRTDMALAGGVNISIHPNKYSILSTGQYISSRGQCESFGSGGDGYVPGEGVGVVVLKRLADAERDGDHIYGVIKSSALNHGGKTHGYSVPNPNAQQMAIGRALREANIDPRAVNYIEAHGTGTKLGDPIEITGLTKAFGKYAVPGYSCWIGSAKSNIGHAESAAGIAGLTKVLLQMREGQIAPSLHSETLNPNIDFSATPFQVNQQLREWQRPVIDGRVQHRTAGVSSYGAGGSNAHMVIEEYIGPESVVAARLSDAPCAFVLSAKTEQQLGQYAESLVQFVRRQSDANVELSLPDMAFTLQTGREAMPQRLGFIAGSVQQLTEKLSRFLQDNHEGLYLGKAKHNNQTLTGQEHQTLDELLANWVNGAGVDWHQLYASYARRPSRISLPTYPFARERYWLELPEKSRRQAAVETVDSPAGSADTLMLYPVWKDQSARKTPVEAEYAERRILFSGPVIEIPGAVCLPLHSVSRETDSCFNDYAVQVFEQVKELFGRKPAGRVLLQIVAGTGDQSSGCPGPLLGALAAMLKTAQMENPQFTGQLIELDTSVASLQPAELAAMLHENGNIPAEQHVRYSRGKRQVMTWAELDDGQHAMPVWKQGGVYLITGGAGGLGLIFAREIVRQVNDVTLILTGRSELDDARRASIEALQASGAKVEYRIVDVSDKQAVTGLVQSCEGSLNGIIHSAGIIRDNFIFKKTAAELQDVLAAKVSGVVNLDQASRSVNLDFFILFSSLAGAVGNPGQSDYATANAFMDAYAAYRNRLASKQSGQADAMRPKGHTLSINWPLWQQGGMDIDPQSKEMMWQTAGLKPIRTQAGIDALYRSLASGKDRVMALEGDVPRLRQLFLDQQREPASNEPAAEAVQLSDPQQLQAKVEDLIATLLSEMLKLPPHRIEVDVPIEQYGVDSVSMMKLTGELEKVFGPLPKTLFFEHPSIDAVGAYLVDRFPQQLTALFKPTPTTFEKQETVAEQPEVAKAAVIETAVQTGLYDIAVIGMSGRFPQANDLDEFWQNLAEGKDCITEIPAQRWDHQQYFDPDKNKPGKSYCKWGGFLDDVAGFDPLFFKISPREAELLDPQERLFLETVWNLLESAGYLGETLQRLSQSRVGVFAGSMTQQYHAFESDLVRESVVALSSHSSIANRVSYFFNFQGPSIAIDTMCSSSLVAIHMACDSLLKGECKIAVAGGVNLTIHPKKYIGLSAGQIIGSSPDSSSFGDGDGYLPAEAVGAVLLKPLKDAIADNDTILAVIKSTAINHGGQSNGYSVPSASAQADLIAGNFAKAGIDPRTVSYVESAANGSPLGDVIELNALTAGFAKYTAERQFCAIGAVKSNIGHAEAASGMSQLIKVLLQLQHRQLAPTIKAEPLNPNISFEQTPFHLQRQLEQWRRPEVALDGSQRREYPRRATVSSFGAGGSNAHLIVEEYQAARQQSRETGAPQLMLFSAKTAAQLQAVVRQMLAFIGQQPELSLANLAYTLQTGREAMEYRMALVVDGREQLIQSLQAYLRGAADNTFTGDHEQDNSDVRQLLSGKTGQSMLQMLLAEKELEKLALYWVKGVKIVWQGMHQGETLSRIALPTYPFERKSYWLGGKTVSGDAPLPAPDSDMPFVIDAQQSMRDNMERYLAHSLSRSLDIPGNDISMSKSLQDYGLDSMFSIKLQRGFEQVFGVKLSARDLSTHATLAALAGFAEAQRVKKNGSELASENTASKPQPAMLPLSEGQKGLWLLHQLAPQMSAYNIPVALRFRTGLNVGLFRRVCELMLQRYPVLGSVFRRHNGELYQTLLSDARLCFTHDNSEADVIELFREKSKQPFDLERGPLFRVHLLSPVSAADSYVLITVHHIVFDGSSAVLLVKALLDTYRRLLAGTEPEYTQEAGYNDFVRWQQQFMAGEQAQMQLDYWKARLSGELPALSLPCDYPRPAEQRFNGASYELALASDLTEKIRELAKSLRVNLSVLFLGVLNMLLHRYSGDDDILVGMPTSGRPESRFDDVVGYFINMIVIRSRVSGRQSVAEFLGELQLTVADGLDNADYPFPALLKELKAGRDQSRSPLFQVMYAYQNFIQPDDLTDLHGGAQTPLPMEFLSGINQEGSHDLALEVYQGKDNFQLKLDYNTDLFSAGTIHRAMAHYINLLRSITSRPASAIAEHALLSEDEKQRIVFDWNAGTPEYGSKHSVVELFQRQAHLTPDNTALLFEHQPLSYRELDLYSSKLANYLLDQGVAAGDPIGVCMGRGLQMVAAMLAIFKAGAVYVPIAPDYPEQRIRHLLDDSKTKLLITEARLRGNIQALASDCLCVAVDQVWDEILASAADLTVRIRHEQAAYVIYTSGSTGLPKGVVIAHGAISHHCQVMRDYYRLTPEDRVLQFASVNVDASLEQVLPGLLTGATVVIRPDELWSPQAFRNNVLELGISVADVPPSYLYELLLDTRTDAEWAALRPLRLVITGGEALTPETLSLWRSSPLRDCRLVNAYGPTETTITSTVFEIGAETSESTIAASIPIGRPLAGESAYILDAYGQPVPVGVPGELHIGGAGLAIGYLNQPELTRQKFIDNPVNPGSRVYKTGDLARWLDDGTIAFLGRLDHQVKIRGFRVECGEIEAALQDLDSVRQAVVLARPVNGNTQLVAFIVPAAGSTSSPRTVAGLPEHTTISTDLKQALAARLPDYMIPAVFVRLAQIPVTPGGKVDRAALMQLDSGSVENRSHVAPRTELEAQLAEIWHQVLNVERVGVHDNFFDLGGHSLLSVRLMAVIHKKLGQELPLSSLFQAPDIAGQAKLLQQNRQPWTPLVCLQPNGDMAPLFCIHAVAGNVLCYQELSRHIGRQRPFYGLQAPDIDSGAHPGGIEGLAALYIATIRSVQAQGPYNLGGWSMGGVIAYEMARQLQQAGEQVGTLALIESYTPEAVQAFEQDYLDKNHLPGDDGETLLLMMFARELGLDGAETMPAGAAASDLIRRLDALFEQAKQAGLLPEDIDSAQLHRLFSVFEANVKAMNRYVPGQYLGDVRLLHAGSANQKLDANGGWAELINGDLSIEAVPGDHYSILRQPNVQFLADKWGDYVNKKTG